MATTQQKAKKQSPTWSSLDQDAQAVLIEISRLAKEAKSTGLAVANEDLCRATQAVGVLVTQGYIEVFAEPGHLGDREIYELATFANKEEWF
jgi:hypothetical protein